MKKVYQLIFPLLLIVGIACGQPITGRVTDSVTHIPMADVSVYVVNSTQGTKTDANGNFSLSNAALQGDGLIFYHVGYQTKQIPASQLKAGASLNIVMSAKVVILNEVVIDNDWKKNLRLFRRDFLGTTDTTSCKILNPEILDIRFSKTQNRLTASSPDFLDIENYLTGYKLRFLVSDFWADYNTMRIHYKGKVIFEELKGAKAAEKKWKRNRKVIYDLSIRSLLAAMANGLTKKDGFEVRALVRTPNPNKPPQNVIAGQLIRFSTLKAKGARDSLKKWTALSKMPATLETYGENLLTGADLVKPGTQPGTYTMVFNDYLYVVNKRVPSSKPIEMGIKTLGESVRKETATLKMKSPGSVVIFTKDGNTINGDNLIMDGYLNSQIIGMLPFDFQPGE